MQEVKDAKILEMLSNDSQFDKGFELLVQKYQERLYWHIRNYVHFHQDADDIIQNTFIKVFKNIKGFESKSKLYTWMYRIATNESINYINKNKRHVHSNVDEHLIEFEEKLKAEKELHYLKPVLVFDMNPDSEEVKKQVKPGNCLYLILSIHIKNYLTKWLDH